MSPDDLAVVRRSWAELRPDGDAFVEQLARSLAAVTPPGAAERRAHWLVESVGELIDLLPAPSQLDERLRQLAATGPDGGPRPSVHVDGRAWMTAARAHWPGWTSQTEHAWHRAWLLVGDVLAAEVCSPFVAE